MPGGSRGRAVSALETRIDGEPGPLRRAASWLGDTLARAAAATSDVAHVQQGRLATSWSGEAAAGARARTTTLTARTDELAAAATATGSMLEALASALDDAQADMAHARAVALAGGLRVEGTLVHPPTPARPVPALPVDATPQEADAHDAAMRAHADATAKASTFDEVVRLADAARARWARALSEASAVWGERSGNLVGLTADLLSAGVEASAVAAFSRFAAAGAQAHSAAAARLAGHVDALSPGGRVVTTHQHWYELYDAMRTESAAADDAARAARSGRVPVGLGRALGGLGVLATGYGIYDDIQQGESPAQAAVSNGVGFGASLLAGAGTGAVVGSFIPVPVVGTVVGAVAGTVVGAGVGLITSGMIDSMWENGVDSIGDVGDAIADGWDEMTGTVADAGDLVGGAADAVGGTVKDAWDAIF